MHAYINIASFLLNSFVHTSSSLTVYIYLLFCVCVYVCVCFRSLGLYAARPALQALAEPF